MNIYTGQQKQEELTAAANDGRNAVTSLLPIVKSISQDIENQDLKARCLQAGRESAKNYSALLSFVKTGTARKDSQTQLRTLSHDVANSIAEIVQVSCVAIIITLNGYKHCY